MKRYFLILCVLLLSVGSFSQNSPLILYGLPDYQLMGLSPNGKWACGAFSNGASQLFAFRWNLVTNEMTLLSEEGNETVAFAISDNGVVVGTFPDKEATANKAPVATAGYWKDGKWHHLETIDGAYISHPDYGGQALCISRNGEYIGGAMYNEDNKFTPVIWKDGKIFKNYGNGYEGAVKVVSDDGKIAGGWSYTKKSEGTRVPTLWEEGKEPVYLCKEEDGNFWRGVKGISPNQKLLLFDASIYNLETGVKTPIPSLADDPWNFELCAINNDQTVVGFESAGMYGSDQYAFIYKNGKSQRLEEYLKEMGVDFSKDGVVLPNPNAENSYCVVSCQGISEDGKTFAIMFFDTETYSRPMIIKLDENVLTREPVALQCEQLEGINSVKLVWNAPLSNQEGVKGYNVYRNGSKINAELLKSPRYVDASLSKETYSYAVTALYGQAESAKSGSVSVTIVDKKIESPYNLYARQKGLDNVYLQWSVPRSNLINKKYYDSQEKPVGFGGGNVSFESAIRYDQQEMAQYQGYKITNVAFYPMSRQEKWTINIYCGKEQIYTEDITSELVYKQENNIKLKKAVDIPTNGDIYVAIKVNVPSTSSSNDVLGHIYGKTVPGYSDLVRQVGEKDFYSLYEQAQLNGYDFSIAWAISMILAPENVSGDIDKISQYNIYANGGKAGTAEVNNYMLAGQDEGKYVYEVEAVYADGRVSDKVTTEYTLEKDEKFYKSISSVSVQSESSQIIAKWEAPVDDDETLVTYSDESPKNGILGPEKNNYGYMAKVTYDQNKLRSYGGYEVKALRFYPMAEADFTFIVNVNGEEVCNHYVENYIVGQWNTVNLDQPFIIEEGATYDLILDCFDVAPKETPLAVDGQVPFVGISDSYSTNRGETFSSLFAEASTAGNWLLGMLLTSPNVEELPIEGYNVRIDGDKKNENLLTDTQFTFDMGTVDEQAHRINVDIVYNVVGEIKGNAVFFKLQPTGIEENEVAAIRLFPNPATSYVKIEGGIVDSVVAYGANGKQVAQSNENVLDVSDWDTGLYILKIRMDGKEKTAKLSVIR